MLYGEKGLFLLSFTARIAVLYSLSSLICLGGLLPEEKMRAHFELREQILKPFPKNSVYK